MMLIKVFLWASIECYMMNDTIRAPFWKEKGENVKPIKRLFFSFPQTILNLYKIYKKRKDQPKPTKSLQ